MTKSKINLKKQPLKKRLSNSNLLLMYHCFMSFRYLDTISISISLYQKLLQLESNLGNPNAFKVINYERLSEDRVLIRVHINSNFLLTSAIRLLISRNCISCFNSSLHPYSSKTEAHWKKTFEKAMDYINKLDTSETFTQVLNKLEVIAINQRQA